MASRIMLSFRPSSHVRKLVFKPIFRVLLELPFVSEGAWVIRTTIRERRSLIWTAIRK